MPVKALIPLAAALALVYGCTGRAQQAVSADPSPAYSVSGIGPHFRIWEAAAAQTNLASSPRKHRIREIGSGITYLDPQTQTWQPSQAGFVAEGDSFVATKVYHPAQIAAANLNTTGAVQIACEGVTLSTTPLSILLFDPTAPASSNSVVLASIADCSGVLINSNQVLFANALTGSISADVIFEIHRGSFSQNIVITTSLDPSEWGLSQDSQLQILTELYNPPVPQSVVSSSQSSNQPPDTILIFGPMVFGHGYAYYAPDNPTNVAAAPVSKTLFESAGRWFLQEAVPLTAIQAALQALPKVGQASRLPPDTLEARAKTKPSPHSAIFAALPKPGPKAAAPPYLTQTHGPQAATRAPQPAIFPPLPPNRQSPIANRLAGPQHSGGGQPTRPPIQTPAGPIASVPSIPHSALRTPRLARPGVVIDYLIELDTGSSAPYVFQSDTTYFINGECYFYNQVTLEASVLKFPLADPYIFIQLNSNLVVAASSWRPAIVTAADDSSCGETITTNIWPFYTGNPSGNVYADPALWFSWPPSALQLAHCRFNYASLAIQMDFGSSGLTLSHCQFLNSSQVLYLTGDCCANVTLNNCLLASVGTAFSQEDEYNSYTMNNCTVDSAADNLLSDNATGTTIACTNCIFSSIGFNTTPSGNFNGFYNTTTFGNNAITAASSPYQTVGGGAYYLSGGSLNPFRQAGITNIGPLLTDLALTTTHPPVFLSNLTISANTTLSPEVQRDSGGAALDLGFHYDAADFELSQVEVTNAVVSLADGVVIAGFGPCAFYLDSGASLVSVGTPVNLNHIVSHVCVQESPLLYTGAGPVALFLFTTNPPADLSFRFTDFSLLSGVFSSYFGGPSGSGIGPYGPSELVLRDSQLRGGYLEMDNAAAPSFGPSLAITNTLFERVETAFKSTAASSSPLNGLLRNNLLWNGSLAISNSFTGAWSAYANLFYNVGLSNNGVSGVTNSHNCYINTPVFAASGGNDVTNTAFTFVPGPAGPYYQISNSICWQKAETTADRVGLFHFSVLTNGPVAGTNTASIGPHFVALTNGVPISNSGDGIGDYLKDSNGDGIYNAGDLGNWRTNDTCGDGSNDYIKYLEGRNLNVKAAGDTNGLINLLIYTPLK